MLRNERDMVTYVRKFLFFTAFIIITCANANVVSVDNTQQIKQDLARAKLAKLESSFDGRIGVYAINTNDGQVVAYRANERFPVQSTLKLIGVSALLKQSNSKSLQEKIYYTKNDLTFWHPITGKYLTEGMTLEALSEAAISYSDNPAMNLIMKKLGGPKAVTDFAQSIGNKSFNTLHYEGNLNSNPKDERDTSTPKDMAMSVQKLTLGNVLTPAQKMQLITWMKNDTVGYKRIRSGVPLGWSVADKTGSGDYGVANDIGITWSPLCKPIVLAIYTAQKNPGVKRRDDIVARATTIILDEFARHDGCFKALFN